MSAERERIAKPGRSVTWAELVRPSDGSLVEFWCRRMSQQGKPGAGISGWFRGGLFWSVDNADHYAPGEVTHWLNVRNSMQCAAPGVGRRVNEAKKGGV